MFLDYFQPKCISRFNSSNEQEDEECEICEFGILFYFNFFSDGIDF
jgi:hypothetical protein